MFNDEIILDAGPATLIPLVHVPLLKKAPRSPGEYKVVREEDDDGDVMHFYGDFSGFHIYMIATTYKKRIVDGSLDYFDKKNGLYSLSLEITTASGEVKIIEIESCKCPLHQQSSCGLVYPSRITVEKYSTGTLDSLMFHFDGLSPKFKFANSLIPNISDEVKLSLSDFFDLKVEYIGKSVGKDGTREISDRLGCGHSTETRILNRLSHRHTHLDAYAILYKPTPLTNGEDGPLSSMLSFAQVVDALEKSLIAKFLPKENKNSRFFPNDSSEPVKLLSNLGVTKLWISAESPLEYGLLYSDEIERDKVHKFDIKIPSYR